MVKPKALLKTDFVTVLKNMFQANYSDTQIAKNEAVPVCVCVCVCVCVLSLNLNMLLFAGVLSKGATQKNSEKYEMFWNFQVITKCSSFIVKQLFVLFELKI